MPSVCLPMNSMAQALRVRCAFAGETGVYTSTAATGGAAPDRRAVAIRVRRAARASRAAMVLARTVSARARADWAMLINWCDVRDMVRR